MILPGFFCFCDASADDPEKDTYDETDDAFTIRCTCRFEFNGVTFALVDSAAKRVKRPER